MWAGFLVWWKQAVKFFRRTICVKGFSAMERSLDKLWCLFFQTDVGLRAAEGTTLHSDSRVYGLLLHLQAYTSDIQQATVSLYCQVFATQFKIHAKKHN